MAFAANWKQQWQGKQDTIVLAARSSSRLAGTPSLAGTPQAPADISVVLAARDGKS
jgi:hypothetical protein